MTTTAFGVYGQQPPGYMPGNWNGTFAVGPNPGDALPHSVAATRFGQRCELRIRKVNPADPEVMVRVVATAHNSSYQQRGDGGVIISDESPPLEIYDPLGGVLVTVQHANATGSAFVAELYPVDGSRNKARYTPLYVDQASENLLAATAITIAKPPSAGSKDLLVAFVGVMDAASPAPTPTIPTGLPAGDPAGTWLDLGTIIAGANPTIHCYARVITGADPANYTWSDPAGVPDPRRWGGLIRAYRLEGANNLDDYGLGFYPQLGVPSIAAWAKSGTTQAVTPPPQFFGAMQYAQLDPIRAIGELGAPALAVYCFGIHNGASPGPWSPFHIGQSAGTLLAGTATERVTLAEMKPAVHPGDPPSADVMFSVGDLVAPCANFQPTVIQLGTAVSWEWQGSFLPLIKT